MKKLIAILLLLVIVFMLLLEVSNVCKYFFFDTVKINNGNTKMVAHRGSPWLEVENTDAAFEAAGQRSYFAIEADLRKTADGEFVICHDPDLKRLAWQNIHVESSTLEELLVIPLKDEFGRECTKNRLTVLQNYVQICKKHDKTCFLELKSEFSLQDIERIIEIIGREDYLHQVTFISMDRDNLVKLRSLLPDQSAQYVTSEYTDETLGFLKENRLDLALKYVKITKKIVNELHDAGIKINLWTVNNQITAMILVSWGVDYITTNILE